MEENQQQKTTLNILKQQDISQVIKHFSFTIQQRFEQIQKNFNYFTCLNSINYDRSELEKQILYKYNEYKTSNQYEIKLLEKFVQRLLQIFDFFKQKTEQPEILQQMSQKISEKLKQILKNQSNYHFFVNNRPKTHTINAKPLGIRSTSNDFLSIVGPRCQKNDKDFDSVLIDSKKTITQTPQKRVIEVGKLFKYVFSVLKRGYLVKLRMQRPQKKHKTVNKQNCQKSEENNTTISVEGTCAILRNCSQKGNKQNIENHKEKLISFCKEKFSINPLSLVSQNRKQFQITQKIKNRSISTNQYSFLSSQNPSTLKQSTSKIRQIERKINSLYSILNVQKYSILKVAKQPDICKKDQLKRNVLIENEFQKFQTDYQKWSNKDTKIYSEQKSRKNLQKNKKIETDGLKIEQICDTQQNIPQEEEFCQEQNDIFLDEQQNRIHRIVPLQINSKTEENESYQIQLTSTQDGRRSKNHTLIVHSSRSSSKPLNNVLTDKSSNLIDFNINKNPHQLTTFKHRSTTHSQKKSLRLNLPNMLIDKSNLLNQIDTNINLGIKQKSTKPSEKSQYYLQNYHIDTSDDGAFVPLLPKKDKNIQNLRENRNQFTLKKNNLLPNFHPLNRCRLFRQKKLVRNSIMIPLMEFKANDSDLTSMNGRVKNAIF